MDKIRMLRTARRPRQALPVAKHCLNIAREVFDPGDIRICQTLELLADLALEVDETEEALRHYAESYEICGAAGDPDRRARLAGLMGSIHRSAGHNTEAARYLNESLIAQQETGAENHLDRAGIANSLALIALEIGDLEAAEAHYREALESCRLRGSSGEEDAAVILNNIGILYFNADRLEEAEAIHQEALALRQQRQSVDPLAVAQSASNLAAVHHAQRRHPEAEALYEKAISLVETSKLPGSSDYAVTLQNYAQLLRESGQKRRAKAIEGKIARLPGAMA